MSLTLSAFHCGTALPTLTNMSWMCPANTSNVELRRTLSALKSG
jgi:hypothetical protein